MSTQSTTLPHGVTATILYDGDDRDAWLEARRVNGVGASEAPAVLGASRFSSPAKVYADKVMGRDISDAENEAMKWGRIMEPFILQEYAKDDTRFCQHETRTFQSDTKDFMLASIDGWIIMPTKTGTVQVKKTIKKWEETGVPKEVWIQMQQEFYVTGLDWGSAVALLNNSRLRHAEVERDNTFIDDILVPTIEEFWGYVTDRVPLPLKFIDGSETTKKALAQLYPEDLETSVVHFDGDLFLQHKDLAELKDAAKHCKEEIAEIENKIRAAIGTASAGYFADGSGYTHKTITRHEKPREARTSEFRQLRYKKAKGE